MDATWVEALGSLRLLANTHDEKRFLETMLAALRRGHVVLEVDNRRMTYQAPPQESSIRIHANSMDTQND